MKMKASINILGLPMDNRANWLYFLQYESDKKSKECVFLYGLSLPTKHNTMEAKISQIGQKKINKKCILVFASVTEFKSNLIETIDFKAIHSKCPHQSVIVASKSIIQVSKESSLETPESLLQTPMSVDIYYTNELVSYKEGFYFKDDNIEELSKIAQILENESGQSFSNAYSKRLGCFEYATPQAWSELTVTPFIFIETKDKILLRKTKEFQLFITEDFSVHLIAYKNDEIVLDKLIQIKNNKAEQDFNLLDDDYHYYEYWVFNQDGILIDRDRKYFIEKISLNGNQICAEYALSQVNYTKKSSLKHKERSVKTTRSFNIDVDSDKGSEPIVQKLENLYQKLKIHSIKEDTNDGQWFVHTDKGHVEELIKYFNCLTKSNNCTMTIFDPYLSEESLEYFLHLTNLNLKLNFVSYLKKQSAIDDIITSKLNNYKDYTIPLANVMWYNVKDEFHDRIIYIQNTITNSTEMEQIYILSNSLNNLLKSYDFCIVPLNGKTKKRAKTYIDNLLLNKVLLYPARK